MFLSLLSSLFLKSINKNFNNNNNELENDNQKTTRKGCAAITSPRHVPWASDMREPLGPGLVLLGNILVAGRAFNKRVVFGENTLQSREVGIIVSLSR